MGNSKHKIARFIKMTLIYVITPASGFLQRIDLTPYRTDHSLQPCGIKNYLHKILSFFVRFFSWFCQGLITLAYPTMDYCPIAARRLAESWQWASQLLQMPSAKLEEEAKTFLLDIEQLPLTTASSKNPPTFTILICFHHHLDFFKHCLVSIKTACSHRPETDVEVLIINDDPSIDSAILLKEASQLLPEKITLYSNEHNLGICRSANQAIVRAKGEWILHLDCDDCLTPEVFSTLDQTIQQQPYLRYISSRAVDIDEQGKILSWRLRSEQPSDLLKNNVASHLKVIRKDLHETLGFFNPIFEGCQDYEFALRTVLHEPLCFIPDYLYHYRWHDQSQTVSNNGRQNHTAAHIRQTYLLAIHWMIHGTAMIEWNITGHYAHDWQQLISTPSTAARYRVTLEATSPYHEYRWKLLLIQLATIVIDRYRTGDKNNELAVVL